MELKNRIIMAPMGTTADGDGGYSARTIRYFTERAKGGTGLIITGRNASVLEFEGYSCSALSNYHHVNRLAALADNVHAYGCKICVQIGPGLGRIMYTSATTPPYSCSPIPAFWFPNLTCKELSIDDIHFITDKVGYSAKLAKDAGADAIEMQLAHSSGGVREIYNQAKYMPERVRMMQWYADELDRLRDDG